MTLTAADVAEIMRLVEQSQFDHLSLEMDGVKLSLSRTGVASGPQRPDDAVPVFSRVTADHTGSPDAGTGLGRPPGVLASTDPTCVDVTAPMLGTFYRAPKPGAAPFVEVGSAVTQDTVIGIIEVMKLMNTVRAGVKGIVVEISQADETLVEFGAVLMRMRPDA